MSYDLSRLGSVGRNVNIHESVIMFNPGQVHVGDNVRIDCMSVISAGPDGVHIGQHVHLAAGVMIFGGSARVTIGAYVGLSARTTVYSATDDFTDGAIAVPTVPQEFRGVRAGPVEFGPHAIIGSGSVILPGVTIGEGAAVGALTLVSRDVPEYDIVVGAPMRRVGERARHMRELQRRFEDVPPST